MKRNQLIALVLATLAMSYFAQASHAQRVRWSVGIGIGAPYYGRPWYGPGYGYGWGPYPYYYAPPPVVVYDAPPPVVVRPAPVVVQSPSGAPSAPTAAPPAALPVASVVPAQNVAPASPEAEQLVRKLSDTNDVVRRDAAMDLGRMKAQSALDALANLLAKDSSPAVRDAAARALGLIASPRSLNALIYAAQADQDRDVRHSAQFAVEIIRTNLRGK